MARTVVDGKPARLQKRLDHAVFEALKFTIVTLYRMGLAAERRGARAPERGHWRVLQDFEFYVTDDRYDVRSVLFVHTRDAEAARLLAQQMLADRHHLAVEVWSNDRRLFSLGDPAGLTV